MKIVRWFVFAIVISALPALAGSNAKIPSTAKLLTKAEIIAIYDGNQLRGSTPTQIRATEL